MKIKDERLKKIKKIYNQAYENWSTFEKEKLTNLFSEGLSIKEISYQLGRQVVGIRSQLIKIGLIKDENIKKSATNSIRENLISEYPLTQSNIPIVITEVTRMQNNYVCVAGFDFHSKKIRRPLQSDGKNWQELNVHEGIFEVGNILYCKPFDKTKLSHSSHGKEDFLLTKTPQPKNVQLNSKDLFNLISDFTWESVSSTFGSKPLDKNKSYYKENVALRSLGVLMIDKISFLFFEKNIFGNNQLRAKFKDKDNSTYNFPITSLELQKLHEKKGIKVLHTKIQGYVNDKILLRIGLARGWNPKGDANDKRNYIQINGVIGY